MKSLTKKKFVNYYRCSTVRQGISGLGLEAQQAAARRFIPETAELVGEYIEVESGKKNDRPQLQRAIVAARVAGATLLIAKLDRLSRNAAFIFTLRDSGVDFVCADMPDANTLTIGIFAVLAQHERETISRRTKEALAAKKARGFQLGTPRNLTTEARILGKAVRQQNARTNIQNVQATRLSELLRGKGYSLRQIANELNTNGYTTRRGNKFHPATIRYLLLSKSA